MKIVYLNTESLYGPINSGSLRCSHSNFSMVKIACDNQYMHIYLGDEDKKISENIYEFKREENKIPKLLLSLSGRRFISSAKEQKIVSLIEDFNPDILFYEGPYWNNVVKSIKKKCPQILNINFLQNVEKVYYENLRNKSFSMEILYRVTCKSEKESLKYSDKIICLNRRDGKALKEIYGYDCDMFLPINMKDVYSVEKQISYSNEKVLLFVGSLFPPNYDGILWFVNNVMTELKDYRLIIVGRGFETKKSELERSNVTVIGGVDNLEDYYYKYPVMVMPIQYGAGMKVKTAEAIMYGKTIFATSEALEGYNADGINGIYRCNSADEFVKTISKEYNDAANGHHILSVREFFKNGFDTDNLTQEFVVTLKSWIYGSKN